MQETELQVLPGPPNAPLKRRVLEEFLRNPFLDDDIDRLGRRLGEPSTDLAEATAGLCQSKFLKTAARGGFMLEMDLSACNGGVVAVDAEAEADIACDGADAQDAVVEEESRSTEDLETDVDTELFLQQLTAVERELADEIGCGAIAVEEPVADGLPTASAVTVPGPAEPIDLTSAFQDLQADSDVPLAHLLDALPYGVVAFRDDGVLEAANRLAAKWIGVARGDLDGATFEMATGVNPLSVATGEPSLTFSLTSPYPVEISISACVLNSGPGVLISVRDVSLQEEVTRMQGLVQEELFDRFRDEMVHPLAMIEQFLAGPDRRGLIRARAAMEQINRFLKEYYLSEDATESGFDTGREASSGP